jgi:hypothetical protein
MFYSIFRTLVSGYLSKVTSSAPTSASAPFVILSLMVWYIA